MYNSCFCVPIYTPKFKWANELVESYNTFFEDSDIYLIFSSSTEAELFQKSYPHLLYKTIVYDKVGDNEVDKPFKTDSAIITHKKFYGLNYIYNTTDNKYVGVIDADTKFIKKVNYSKLFDEFYNKKTLYGHFTKEDFFLNLSKGFFIPFTPKQQEELKKIVFNEKGAIFYHWFNDVPVYERNDFQEFQQNTTLDNSLKFSSFDYMCYSYYLLLNKKFKLSLIENTSDVISSIGEHSNNEEHFKIIQPMWIRKTLNLTSEDALKNVFLRYHLDRYDPHENKKI